MSTPLLAVGATAVFLAVFTIAYSVQSIVAERRQAYRTLQAIRAVELRPADLRNRELARPARERLLKPFYNAALSLVRRFTPAGARDAIRRRLVMAGSPFGWDAERVLVAKVACLVGGILLGLVFVALLLFNPLFLRPLFTTSIGLMLLGGAAVLMIFGVFWLKKITEIKV